MGEFKFMDWLTEVSREYVSQKGRPFRILCIPRWLVTYLEYDIRFSSVEQLEIQVPGVYNFVLCGHGITIIVASGPRGMFRLDDGFKAVASRFVLAEAWRGIVHGTLTRADEFLNNAVVYDTPHVTGRPLRPVRIRNEDILTSLCSSNGPE